MGRELQWNPIKKQWEIWSTVVCEFVDTAKTPEEVADKILGKDEFYYYRELDPEEKKRLGRDFLIATSMRKRYEAEVKLAREAGNIESLKFYEQLLAGEARPDPQAKEELRQFWIEDARKARAENRRVSLVCEVKIKPAGEVEIRKLPDWGK